MTFQSEKRPLFNVERNDQNNFVNFTRISFFFNVNDFFPNSNNCICDAVSFSSASSCQMEQNHEVGLNSDLFTLNHNDFIKSDEYKICRNENSAFQVRGQTFVGSCKIHRNINGPDNRQWKVKLQFVFEVNLSEVSWFSAETFIKVLVKVRSLRTRCAIGPVCPPRLQLTTAGQSTSTYPAPNRSVTR